MLRQIKEQDWLKIKKLLFEIAEQSFDKVVSEVLEKKIKEDYERFPEGFIISEDNKNLIGLLWFEVFPEKKSAFVHAIYVEPEYRGKGVSDELISYLEDYCKKEKLNKIELNVSLNLQYAIKFYKRKGFQIKRYFMSKRVK